MRRVLFATKLSTAAGSLDGVSSRLDSVVCGCVLVALIKRHLLPGGLESQIIRPEDGATYDDSKEYRIRRRTPTTIDFICRFHLIHSFVH